MIITKLAIDPLAASEQAKWPFNLPPVSQLCADGLRFRKPITFLVGENGSGKSTLIEAIAEAYGLDVRGGHGGRKYAVRNEGNPLSKRLQLELTRLGSHAKHERAKGFFLRSETAMGVFEFMSDMGVESYGGRHLRYISHGEGYIQVLRSRFKERGLYLLDEPEAALSFQSCLTLMGVLNEVVKNGSQVICATHSPLLTALPGAEIFELSDAGIVPQAWKDLALVQHWQTFLKEPGFYLRHLLE